MANPISSVCVDATGPAATTSQHQTIEGHAHDHAHQSA